MNTPPDTSLANLPTPASLGAMEVREPAYAWGQRVIAIDDLVNDGSHPERAEDALLAARGDVGEIVNIGHAQDLNEPVYLVQFAGCVVGCLEIELVPAPRGLLSETEELA
jgi:nitrogen fixation protein NifZ